MQVSKYFRVYGNARFLTFDARGIISMVISLPSSSCFGLMMAFAGLAADEVKG